MVGSLVALTRDILVRDNPSMQYTPQDYETLYGDRPLPREPHLSALDWFFFALAVIALMGWPW